MKRIVNVHKGEATAGRGEVVLKSDIHDHSCFVLVARDPQHHIGCLAHALFTNKGKEDKRDRFLTKEAQDEIDKMIHNMTLLGATPDDIEVSLIAGENIEHEQDDAEYDREINRIHQILKERHIKWRENNVCDCGRKHVLLDVESGRVDYE